MFEDLIREVQRLERSTKFSVHLPPDEKGYLDRRCPSTNCGASFKVFDDDWEKKLSDARAFCALCRHEAPSDEWATPQQIKYAEALAMREFEKRLHGALETGARRFNQRQRPGLINFSLSVKPGATPVFLPRAVGEIMEQAFTCEVCSCRYSSVGAAFFCPACGHNSALSTFAQTLQTVRNTINALKTIRHAFGDSRDAAENTVRLVMEQSLGKLVGAFEHFTEALFLKAPKAPLHKIKRGSFQRLPDASALWREAVGKGYEELLTTSEMGDLVRLFQIRHLLLHADGVVDSDYLQKSGDQTYSVGQRIVVREQHALRLAELIEKIATELKKLIP